MLKRITVIRSLMAALVLFGLLQIVSAVFFYKTVKEDGANLTELQMINQQQSLLNEGWASLLQARINLSRASLRLMMQKHDPATVTNLAELVESAQVSLREAREDMKTFKQIERDPRINAATVEKVLSEFSNYDAVLTEFGQMLKAGDLDGVVAQPTQKHQDNLKKSHDEFQREITHVYQLAKDELLNALKLAMGILAIIFVVIVGVMALVWYGFQGILIRPLKQLIGNIRSIARGDLVKKIEVEGTNEMGQLADSLREMQAALIQTVGDVRRGAEAIYSKSEEISAGNGSLSARTEQQAAALEETAASMEQLTATVKQNADNADQARKMALVASETARQGGLAVGNVVMTMNGIASSSQKIADITNLIDGIAFQTNILALNAAVEAARAGEQGRGFAVVASEVRSLAQRSAEAAKEIKILIDDSVSQVACGSQQAEDAGETMNNIVQEIDNVNKIINEIASASEEQSRGISQVSIAVSEIDTVTQQNSSLVEESAASAVALEEQAERLKQAVAVFRIERGSAGRA
jgi:methyl-accepting chemotaxis protein-1 (serine sensor receptor)